MQDKPGKIYLACPHPSTNPDSPPMATSRTWTGAACLMLLCMIFSDSAKAQSRDLGAEALILDDGAGHRLRISVPTTGWLGLGTFDWVLPLPSTGVTAGFVESGTAALTSLEWDDAGKYWKAVAGSTGGTINADVLALPTTTSTVGQVTINGNRFMHAYGTNNVFVGSHAGNFTLTSYGNTALGSGALSSASTGNANTAVGTSALSNNTNGGWLV